MGKALPTFDDALAILSEKGSDLMKADLERIDLILFHLPIENTWRIYEDVLLIVNDASYNGDIPPIEWRRLGKPISRRPRIKRIMLS